MLGRLAIALAVGFLALVATRGLALRAAQPWVDLDIYLQAMRDYRVTGRLYCTADCVELGFTYPPVAALAFLPLTDLPVALVRSLWTLATIAAAAACSWWILGRLAIAPIRRRFLVAAILVSEPVWMTVGQGQISVLIAAAGLVGYTTLHPRRGGALLAAAAALKITPALAGVVLLTERGRERWIRLGSAAVVGLALAALGLVLGSGNTLEYFGTVLWDTKRIGSLDSWSNSSVMGLLAHWVLPKPLVDAGGILAGAVVVGWLGAAARELDPRDRQARAWLGLAIALGSYLITPIAWTHHCLGAPIAAVALWAAGRRVVGIGCLLVWTLPTMGIAIAHADHAGTALVQSARPVTLMLLFGLTLVEARYRSQGGRSGTSGRPWSTSRAIPARQRG